jgi:branched-chain amino acid transport system permease protein
MSAQKANLEILPLGVQVALGLGLIALAAFPFVGTDFYTQMVTRMMIMAIFAMSLDLLQGVTGLVSLGHAAYFGLAGYALAFLTPQGEAVSLWWTLPVAVLASGLAALIIGFFVVRTHGIYFIMVTMAFAQMVFYLFFDNKVLGGSDGLYINFKPAADIFGWVPFDLENKRTLYYFTLAAVLGVYAFLRRLLWSPFGRALAGIRVNEHRMRAMGFGTFGYKLAAFTLAGALAGLAGYLWGAQTGYINPELMGFHMSAHAIMMVILGGMGNFAGAIVGAFAFEYLLHVFKDLPQVGSVNLGKHWQLWMGLFIVLLVTAFWVWSSVSVNVRSRPMSEVLLSAKNLTKRFGGLAAVNDVSLELVRNHIHAVIGPNGAGKSTLTNLLSGDLPPTTGSVTLGGHDVTGWSPEKISARGLGRSYQKTNIFLPFSVWENVRLAAQSREPHTFRLISRATDFVAVNARTERAIELSGLKDRRSSIAGTISHGEQRQLEIAMTLATEPQVVLLDEPLAGMGTVEAERMVALLLAIKKDHGILLVEHDMDAVFALADRLTVMVNGQVIASGTPAEIRADAGVQAAYLGEEH